MLGFVLSNRLLELCDLLISLNRANSDPLYRFRSSRMETLGDRLTYTFEASSKYVSFCFTIQVTLVE